MFAACVWNLQDSRDPKWLNQVKNSGKANSNFTIFLHWRNDRFIIYQLKTLSMFSNRDCKVAKQRPSSSSSSTSVTSPSSTTRLESAERSNKKALPFTADCSDSTSREDDVLLDNLSSEDFFHWIKTPKRRLSKSANFVGNTLTRIYTPYDVTSPRPRKTTIAFFANFRGLEKLFCAPDHSLNSKTMNQSNV